MVTTAFAWRRPAMISSSASSTSGWRTARVMSRFASPLPKTSCAAALRKAMRRPAVSSTTGSASALRMRSWSLAR